MNTGALAGNCEVSDGEDLGVHDTVGFAASALTTAITPGTVTLADSADASGNVGGTLVISDSRLTIGQTVDGRTTYTVLKNIGGVIQMVGLNISPQSAADGTNYLALTLPAWTKFTDTGFDSLSVQADPRGPVTQSLGQVTLNGELQMQGQLRLWSH